MASNRKTSRTIDCVGVRVRVRVSVSVQVVYSNCRETGNAIDVMYTDYRDDDLSSYLDLLLLLAIFT